MHTVPRHPAKPQSITIVIQLPHNFQVATLDSPIQMSPPRYPVQIHSGEPGMSLQPPEVYNTPIRR